MPCKAATPEAYKLLHEGAIALAEVEAEGIRIDVDYLDATIRETGEQIATLTTTLQEDPVFGRWRRRFGPRTKLGSRPQLGEVIFKEMGYPRADPPKEVRTRDTWDKEVKSKGESNDESAFRNVDLPFVKQYFELERLKKAKNTYLGNIRKEVTARGFLHFVFNLHKVITYRSSCDSPNLQNIPIRNPWIAKLIRRAFIPSDRDHVLVEVDFGGIEVRVAACYNRDPRLIEYIKDPSKDMHRDMAAQCYMLKKEEVSKNARYCGKNMFVFPQFYGDYHINCARSLWENIDRMHLETPSGTSLYDNLAAHGVTELGECNPKERPVEGTFEYHIKEVEKDFWGRRFKVYSEWKADWWQRYVATAGFDMFTGFRVEGVYSKNDVVNYPIQGAAFHCLLWSLVRLVRRLRKEGMRSRVVGQIHDSIIANVHRSEIGKFLDMAVQIMTEELPEFWDWIIVPLEVEVEVGEENWYEKTPWVKNRGVWSPKEQEA